MSTVLGHTCTIALCTYFGGGGAKAEEEEEDPKPSSILCECRVKHRR